MIQVYVSPTPGLKGVRVIVGSNIAGDLQEHDDGSFTGWWRHGTVPAASYSPLELESIPGGTPMTVWSGRVWDFDWRHDDGHDSDVGHGNHRVSDVVAAPLPHFGWNVKWLINDMIALPSHVWTEVRETSLPKTLQLPLRDADASQPYLQTLLRVLVGLETSLRSAPAKERSIDVQAGLLRTRGTVVELQWKSLEQEALAGGQWVQHPKYVELCALFGCELGLMGRRVLVPSIADDIVRPAREAWSPPDVVNSATRVPVRRSLVLQGEQLEVYPWPEG